MPHLHHVDEATDPEEAQKSNHEAPQHHQQQEGERPRLAPEEQQQPAQATVCPVPWNLLLTTINDVPKAETGDGRCRLRDQLGGGDRSTIGPRLRLHKDENNIGAGKLFESQRKQAAAQMRLPLLPPLLSLPPPLLLLLLAVRFGFAVKVHMEGSTQNENNIGAGKLFESHRVPEAQRTAAAQQQHMPSLLHGARTVSEPGKKFLWRALLA